MREAGYRRSSRKRGRREPLRAPSSAVREPEAQPPYPELEHADFRIASMKDLIRLQVRGGLRST